MARRFQDYSDYIVNAVDPFALATVVAALYLFFVFLPAVIGS
jgi:hypothetical protein